MSRFLAAWVMGLLGAGEAASADLEVRVIADIAYLAAGRTERLDLYNTGSRVGDEVVQLYVQDVVSSVTSYDLSLRGFERVSLQPGEKRRVAFTLGKRDLELLDRTGRWTVEPGAFKVMMGSSSTDIGSRGGSRCRGRRSGRANGLANRARVAYAPSLHLTLLPHP